MDDTDLAQDEGHQHCEHFEEADLTVRLLEETLRDKPPSPMGRKSTYIKLIASNFGANIGGSFRALFEGLALMYTGYYEHEQRAAEVKPFEQAFESDPWLQDDDIVCSDDDCSCQYWSIQSEPEVMVSDNLDDNNFWTNTFDGYFGDLERQQKESGE